MATKKFSGVSPYTLDAPKHPDCDHKYKRFLDRQPTSGSSDGEKNNRIRVALFGLGRMGTIHLGNILANTRIELAYAVEANPDLSNWVKNKYNLRETKFIHPKDASVVYEDPLVDGCIIASSTFTHEAIVMGSLKGGKAVMCEKPMTETDEGTKRCYAMSKEVGRPLLCAFNKRFDPSFRNVYDRVRAGDIGRVNIVKSTSRDGQLPPLEYLKTSGGIFHDSTIHDIDMITWILGEYPEEVYAGACTAMIPEIKNLGDYDNIAVTLKFSSGSLGIIDQSRFCSYGNDLRLETFGHKGMLQVQNEMPNNTVATTAEGPRSAPICFSFPSRFPDSYSLELEHFVDITMGKDKLSVAGKMTMAVSKVCTACAKSAKSGLPVKLTWSEEEIPEEYRRVQ